MAALYLLDTNIVLHLVRGNQLGSHLDVTFGLRDAAYRPLVSIVTHGELLVIADRSGWGADKREILHHSLENLVTIDLNDPAILDAYVAVQRASRAAQGGSRELKANDAWIIACAKATHSILPTTDGDFRHLKLPDWPIQYVDPNPFLKMSKPN